MRESLHALGLGMALTLAGCFGGPPSACHEQMIARTGCCPLCDAECRATVDAACADDEHEPEGGLEDDPDDPSTPDEADPEDLDIE